MEKLKISAYQRGGRCTRAFARRKVRDVWAKVRASSDAFERLESNRRWNNDRVYELKIPKIILSLFTFIYLDRSFSIDGTNFDRNTPRSLDKNLIS